MSTSADWLPANHTDLILQAERTIAYLNNTSNQTRMGIIGVNLNYYNEFVAKFNDFALAFTEWVNPAERTPLKTTALLNTEKVFKKAYRTLYTGYLKNNANVTDMDLEAMGLPKRSSGRTPSPVPVTYPEFEVDTSVIRQISIHYHDEGKTNKAKPPGVHGVEILWVISTVPIDDIKDLPHSAFDTRSPYVFVFDDADRGKRLYFALRWENTRGEKGPWSEIAWAIIP